MFGIGMPEMLLILAIALIVIGPKKLPDLAKSLGKAMGEFKKATRELKDSFEINDEIDGMKKSLSDIESEVTSSIRMEGTEQAASETGAEKKISPENDKTGDDEKEG